MYKIALPISPYTAKTRSGNMKEKKARVEDALHEKEKDAGNATIR
jgi:hypothetical protein